MERTLCPKRSRRGVLTQACTLKVGARLGTRSGSGPWCRRRARPSIVLDRIVAVPVAHCTGATTTVEIGIAVAAAAATAGTVATAAGGAAAAASASVTGGGRRRRSGALRLLHGTRRGTTVGAAAAAAAGVTGAAGPGVTGAGVTGSRLGLREGATGADTTDTAVEAGEGTGTEDC